MNPSGNTSRNSPSRKERGRFDTFYDSWSSQDLSDTSFFGDGFVAPNDVLEVINYLNSLPPGKKSAAVNQDAEGESFTDPTLDDDLLLFLATDIATAHQRKPKSST